LAAKLVEAMAMAMAKALAALEINPTIGLPALGKEIGIEGLRTWRVDGYPLSFWYFDRDDCIDVLRLVGQRQDQGDMLIEG